MAASRRTLLGAVVVLVTIGQRYAAGKTMVQPSVRLAVGIITAPGRQRLRQDARDTWAQHTLVPSDAVLRFVMPVRSMADAAVLRESRECADILFTNSTDGRSTAAFRKQWLWFEHALRAYPNAHWVAKLEDDVYVDMGGLRAFVGLGWLDPTRPVIIGKWEYFNWIERAGCPVGFGYEDNMARKLHRLKCKPENLLKANDTCFGPFPFPKASGVVFSQPALRALIGSRARREARHPAPPVCSRRDGHARTAANIQRKLPAKFRDLLSEDIWLGYALRKHVDAAPLVLIEWGSPLHVDNTASRGGVSSVTLIMHDKQKTALDSRAHGPVDAMPNGTHGGDGGGLGVQTLQPDGVGGFSRVRRAHILRLRQPLDIGEYRFALSEKIVGTAAPPLEIPAEARSLLIGGRVQPLKERPRGGEVDGRTSGSSELAWPRHWALYKVGTIAERVADGMHPTTLATKEPIDRNGVLSRYVFKTDDEAR